jgi:hypothetical protein
MDLHEFLSRQGYRRIPLERSGVGHFHTHGSIGDATLNVLVDTGASSTLIHRPLAERLGLSLRSHHQTGGGAGGAGLEISVVEGGELRLEGISPRVHALFAMDLSHVNEALSVRGEPAVDAVLGADVLEHHAAVIDYGSASLYLRG